jgi:hypothetical protein
MSLASMLTELVAIQTIGVTGTDRYNQPITGVTATATDRPARLEQTESIEVTVGEATVISDWRIFFFPDEIITSTSRVVNSSGRIFEVVGTPSIERTPRGPHHIEARLRFIE